MDLISELKKIKQQFENNEFGEDEYKKRQKLILKKWSDESKKVKQLECSRGKCQKKCAYLVILHFGAHLYQYDSYQ